MICCSIGKTMVGEAYMYEIQEAWHSWKYLQYLLAPLEVVLHQTTSTFGSPLGFLKLVLNNLIDHLAT